MHADLEKIKEDLSSRHDFNLLESFQKIDFTHQRFIDFENLSAYLGKSGALFQPEDVVAYIRRLDRDLDCKVSYMEFMDGMLPAETKGKRPSYTMATETSVQKFDKKGMQGTPNKFISRTFQPNSIEKRPGSAIGYQKMRAGTFTTPSRPKQKSLLESSISKTLNKSAERLHKFAKSEQKHYPEIKTGDAINRIAKQVTPIKPILKKSSLYTKSSGSKISSIAKISPSKTVHIKVEKDDIEEISVPNLLKKQAEAEKLLEDLKQDISIKKDVTLDTLYLLFDPEKNDHISPIDFLAAYQQLGLNPTRDEVYLVFNRFDRNMDGRLNYQDIADLFVPHQTEYASIFLDRNGTFKKLPTMGKESTELIKKLLVQYIEIELMNREYKKNLSARSLREAFEQIDSQNKGYFDIDNVFFA